jgi:hypothetical protein
MVRWYNDKNVLQFFYFFVRFVTITITITTITSNSTRHELCCNSSPGASSCRPPTEHLNVKAINPYYSPKDVCYDT